MKHSPPATQEAGVAVNWRREFADLYQRYTAISDDSICDDVINHELGHPKDCNCEGERLYALLAVTALTGPQPPPATEAAEAELKPCPFAHTPEQLSRVQNQAPYASTSFSEDGFWNVICPVCLSTTASYEEKRNAVKAWNARAGSQPPPEDYDGK